MAWIPYGDASETGDSDHIIRIHGSNRPVMRGHHALYAAAMRGPGPLSRGQREMIGVVVSAANGCHY